MSILVSVVLLVVGFVLLLKGADFLVDGAVGFAKRFHVPSLVIGMTIVAFGTSAPEAAVSISASLAGNNAISFSNVLGSNIFNLMVVAGLCAAIKPFNIKRIALTRDYPFLLLITVALAILCLDPLLGSGEMYLSRADGLILLLLMGIYMYINIADSKKNPEEEPEDNENISLIKSFIFFIGGLAAIIFGGDMVVDSGTSIAKFLGVSNTFIGLTIVAIGTSLPELITSLVACKKGEADLGWGNVVGSNIFNILFILGISSFVAPMPVEFVSAYDLAILFAFSLFIYFGTLKKFKLNRPVGISMAILYVIYTIYIIMR